MSVSTARLPAGFEALSPFVDFWAADTAAGRADCRQRSDAAARQAFYAAASPLLPAALDYLDSRPLAQLDSRPLAQLDDAEQGLMRLLLSFAHLAMAEELQRDEEAKHARDRDFLRITRASADEAAAGSNEKA